MLAASFGSPLYASPSHLHCLNTSPPLLQSLWPPTSVPCLVFTLPHSRPSPVQPTHIAHNLRKNQTRATDSAPSLPLCLLPIKPHSSLLLSPATHHGRPPKLRMASSVANAQTSLSAWLASQDLAPRAAASPSDFFLSPCKVTFIKICLTAIQPVSSLCLSFNLSSLPLTCLR